VPSLGEYWMARATGDSWGTPAYPGEAGMGLPAAGYLAVLLLLGDGDHVGTPGSPLGVLAVVAGDADHVADHVTLPSASWPSIEV
jgi:hypothetical protein